MTLHHAVAAGVFAATMVALAAGRIGRLRLPRGAVALAGGIATAALLDIGWRAVDLDVIALLSGLMALAGLLSHHGIFAPAHRLAHWPARRALAVAIVAVALSSALILNDAAVVVLLPILLVATTRAGAEPVASAALMGAAANAGSLLTPFGNPQNAALAHIAGHGIAEFLAHQWLPTLLALAGLLAAARFVGVRHPPDPPSRAAPPIGALPGPARTGDAAQTAAHAPSRTAAWIVLAAVAAFVAAAAAGLAMGLAAMGAAVAATLALSVGRRGGANAAARAVDANVLALFVGINLLTAGLELWFPTRIGVAALGPLASGSLVVLGSNLVGNVPTTLVLHGIEPAWTAAHAQFLVTVTTLGGTLLLTGSAATLLAAEQARKVGIELRFTDYWKWSWWVLPALLVGGWMNW